MTASNAYPTEEFFNSLYHEAVEVSTNQAEVYDYIAHTAYEAGLNQKIEIAQDLDRKRQRSINNIVVVHSKNSQELLRRIRFAREVILNTLTKMTHGTPAEFSWVYGNRAIAIQGIYRKSAAGPLKPHKDITVGLAKGTIIPKPEDLVVFHANGIDASLPLSLLTENSIPIAQMVRTKCREHAEKTIKNEINEIMRKKKFIEEKHEREMKQLEEKLNAKQELSKMKPSTSRVRKVKAWNAKYPHSKVSL